MIKRFDIITIAILLIMSSASLFYSIKTSQQTDKFKAANVILSTYSETRRENLGQEIAASINDIGSLWVKDINGDTLRMKNILEQDNNHFKLIFRCDKSHCESCMREVSKVLKQYIDNDSPKGKIVIIGNYPDRNAIRIYSNFWGIQDVYGVISQTYPFNDAPNKPHFYLLDMNNTIRNVYIPNAYDTKEIGAYLKAVSLFL